MPDQERRRSDAYQLVEAALAAVDPSAAVARHLYREGESLVVGDRRYSLAGSRHISLIAAGKAAVPMAIAAAEALGPALDRGIVVTKYDHADRAGELPSSVCVIEAGHPVPDENSVRGAQAVADLARAAGEDDLVLFLISGGGSALLTLPVPGVDLAQLQAVTEHLLRCGATIDEINTVRKHFSQVKGGQLARLAAPAELVTLVLSDVVGDPLPVIASGPTVADPTTVADARQVLARHGVDTVDADLLRETPKGGDPAVTGGRRLVVGSNRMAALAAAERGRELGYHTLLLTTYVEGEAREVARVAAALAKGVRATGDPVPPPACLIWGGETTVTVRGDGLGGRNQELALAAALALDGWPGVTLLALATDGGDGPTDAAGAIVTGETAERARRRGLDPIGVLDRNDSYPLFAALEDHVRTGPTGTNVNDLLFILVGEEAVL
jgi:hydroxypyruvate reductase